VRRWNVLSIGTWNGSICSGSYTAKNDIDTAVLYDMDVRVKDGAGVEKWHQMIYKENATVRNVADLPYGSFLGMIPVGWTMEVSQSYHMNPGTTNWAQGDIMTFVMEVIGEQLQGELNLENKSGDPDWFSDYNDAMKGHLSYKVKDSTFKYTLTAAGLKANTDYSLIHFVDPYPGNGAGSVGEIGKAMTDGSGNLAIAGDKELGVHMINAKIWIVPSSDYDATAKSMTAWNAADYLFETGMIDYYDADL